VLEALVSISLPTDLDPCCLYRLADLDSYRETARPLLHCQSRALCHPRTDEIHSRPHVSRG